MGGIVHSCLMYVAKSEIFRKLVMLWVRPKPWLKYEGVDYPSYMPFRIRGIETHMQDIQNFKSRHNDIFITTYPKSGTHLIHEVVLSMINNSQELSTDTKEETMLETIPLLTLLDDTPSPRLLNTHLSYKYLPTQHISNRRKIVHFVRNPKDVCVSLFYHVQKDIFININKSWDEYFEMWMEGKLPFETWYDYERGFQQASIDNPGMILTLYFEDMINNPEAEIRKLAKFPNIPCTDSHIQKIVELTSFDNMKQNKKDMSSLLTQGKGFMYRKGKVGDWKTHFNVSQNHRFDAQFEEKMKGSKLKFCFT